MQPSWTEIIARDYLSNVCESDISTVDEVERNPAWAEMILRSYARNLSTLVKKSSIHKDVSANADSMSMDTMDAYINALERLFVIEDIEAWCPAIRSATVIRSGKKREFIDPSIAVAALGGKISYYHDRYGLEADAVLHLEDGRYALIEFKLGSKKIEEGAKHLLKIRELVQEYNEKEQQCPLREPDLFIVITGGNMAYTRDDGVKIVPLGCLKD